MLAVGSGMPASPLARRRRDEPAPAGDVRVEVGPGRARVDDDPGELRAAAVRQQDRVLALPVVVGAVVREHDRIALVDREQPVGGARAQVAGLRAAHRHEGESRNQDALFTTKAGHVCSRGHDSKGIDCAFRVCDGGRACRGLPTRRGQRRNGGQQRHERRRGNQRRRGCQRRRGHWRRRRLDGRFRHRRWRWDRTAAGGAAARRVRAAPREQRARGRRRERWKWGQGRRGRGGDDRRRWNRRTRREQRRHRRPGGTAGAGGRAASPARRRPRPGRATPSTRPASPSR